MDAFSYLSVLLSIILGLAIAQVLQGYRALLLARGRIRLDPAPLIWSGLVLLFAAQAWWASFGLNARRNWDFADFAAILLQMGLLYMLSALVLPDVPAEQPVDLARHFERHRKAFFIFLIAMLASSILKEAVLEHRLTSPPNLAFHLLLVLIALSGIFLRRAGRRYSRHGPFRGGQ
jgi:hypothetical protein